MDSRRTVAITRDGSLNFSRTEMTRCFNIALFLSWGPSAICHHGVFVRKKLNLFSSYKILDYIFRFHLHLKYG